MVSSVSRSTLRHSRVRVQGKLAGIPPSSAPSGNGVLLQPGPGPSGEHVHQGPGVLCLPGGSRDGVFGLQKGDLSYLPGSCDGLDAVLVTRALIGPVHPQRSGCSQRFGDGGQRDEDRGLWPGEGHPPYRLLQEDHKRKRLL